MPHGWAVKFIFKIRKTLTVPSNAVSLPALTGVRQGFHEEMVRKNF